MERWRFGSLLLQCKVNFVLLQITGAREGRVKEMKSIDQFRAPCAEPSALLFWRRHAPFFTRVASSTGKMGALEFSSITDR